MSRALKLSRDQFKRGCATSRRRTVPGSEAPQAAAIWLRVPLTEWLHDEHGNPARDARADADRTGNRRSIQREEVPTLAEAEEREAQVLGERLLDMLARGRWAPYRVLIEELADR